MRYLGIDVHSKACVWCLLNAQGEIVEQGSTETTIPALQALVTRLGKDDELLAGQEVGAMAYLVHDALKGAAERRARLRIPARARPPSPSPLNRRRSPTYRYYPPELDYPGGRGARDARSAPSA